MSNVIEQQSIGMMEGAFFVPKSDLLNWINSSLNLNITKIQQLGTGAVYCQIIDMMFPGKVPLSKVNWKARNQWQFISNLKILQQSFGKCKIHKHIEIEKLSKSKYQDNLEFIQWMKRYFDLYNKSDAKNYDPVAARKNADIDFSFVDMRSHPLKREKDQVKQRIKSRSPYDNVRPKINNRSVTLQKYSHENADFYLGKLNQIKCTMQKIQKYFAKDHKRKVIDYRKSEELPTPQTPEPEQEQMRRIQTVPSKKLIKKSSDPKLQQKNEIKKQVKPKKDK